MAIGSSTGVTSHSSLYPVKYSDDRKSEHLGVKVDSQEKAVGPNNGQNVLQAEIVEQHIPYKGYPQGSSIDQSRVIVGGLVNVRA